MSTPVLCVRAWCRRRPTTAGVSCGPRYSSSCVLGVLALLIGGRVSAETQFRDQADAARTARMQAELLYRTCSSPTAHPS